MDLKLDLTSNSDLPQKTFEYRVQSTQLKIAQDEAMVTARWINGSDLSRCTSVATILLFCTLGVLSADRSFGNGKADAVADRFQFVPGNWIAIPINVFGEDCRFMVDTGSTYTGLAARFRRKLGAKVKDEVLITQGGPTTDELFISPPLIIGSLNPKRHDSDGLVFCDPIGHRFRKKYDGILGLTHLRSKMLHINFDERYAEFIEKSSDDGRHQERMNYSNLRAPGILIKTSDEGFVNFTIDTGAIPDVTLTKTLFGKLLSKKRIKPRASRVATTENGETTIRTGILDELDLGPYQFSNVYVIEGEVTALGLGFLSRFDVELDFPNSKAGFNPGKRIESPFLYPRAGFLVKRDDQTTIVGLTQTDSDAFAAGIRDDDILVSIDGIAAETLDIVKVRELLSEPGAQRRFVFLRDGINREVKLKLSNEPAPFPRRPLLSTDEDAEFDK